jgi:molybdate transport system ATP-binding protein
MVAIDVIDGTGLVADFGIDREGGFALNVSLDIGPGRTIALLGPNGAGKSTVVAAIAGLIAVDRGSIALDGTMLDDRRADVFVASEERGVGVMFQDHLLFAHMSVADNIAFGLRSRGMSVGDAGSVASDWCNQLDLSELERRSVRDLSGGQAQRVALARALATNPSILLLDEPLAALDVTTKAKARKVLGEHLDAFSGPKLLITHDPGEAFLLADEVHVIEDGKITQVGSAEEITRSPRTEYAADLAGTNLLRGEVAGGVVVVGTHVMQVADSPSDGPTLLTIHPRAVSLHRQRPEGSARNAWQTTVSHIEIMADRCRVSVDVPVPLTSEVTTESVGALGLEIGSTIWVSVKATEIGVQRS